MKSSEKWSAPSVGFVVGAELIEEDVIRPAVEVELHPEVRRPEARDLPVVELDREARELRVGVGIAGVERQVDVAMPVVAPGVHLGEVAPPRERPHRLFGVAPVRRTVRLADG
jgi:hypothetical protein